jgi:uncharacterized protein (TIGR00255 family)
MIQSMTGFATKTFTLSPTPQKKSNVSMSLKTLNSRFFEATCKLPQALLHLETALISLLKQKLHRGHIYLVVYLNNQDIFQGNIEPAYNTINAYIHALNNIKKEHQIQAPVTLETIIRLPNIFSIEEQTIDEASKSAFFTAMQELIDQLIEARAKEGIELEKDFKNRITVIQQEINYIEQQTPLVADQCKKKVERAVQEAGVDAALLADAHKNVLYTLLEKLDIHEEITRFKSHLINLIDHLQSADIEKGKRLDFILQELIRETNTINAKCSDSIISNHAITMKVEIEKMREQIQNIV